jgi:hypothetical protein
MKTMMVEDMIKTTYAMMMKGCPYPMTRKTTSKREVLAETTPVDGHEVEEGTSSLLETYDDDIDDVDTLMGSKNDDTGYIPLTTPTKQEADMEQESEEGMEDVRTETTMNMDPMAVKEKGEMTLYATNKKAVVFPLAYYPPIILRVKFSVKPVTSFMTKDIIRARISKTLHHDFSPKTCKDVSTQDLKKYMDWLCDMRLILMISLHYFPHYQSEFSAPQASSTHMIKCSTTTKNDDIG